jgi:hypothetical protein
VIRTLPCCGYKVDAHTSFKIGSNKVLPTKGDAAICINCGCWHVYTDTKGNTRAFEADDLLTFSDEELHQMRQATRLIKKRGRIR